MKYSRMQFSRFSLFIALLLLCSSSRAEVPVKPGTTQLTSGMKAGAEYLVRVTQPSGEFVYRDSLQEDKEYKPVYNVVRHGGTLYAMADYYSHFRDPALRSALVRGANFLKQKYMKPIPGEKDTLAIWELSSDREGADTEVKLGGLALGLVGLVGTEEAAPGTTPLKTLRQLGNGILYLQEKDGSFYSKYNPTQGGKQDRWQSLYYPGEAALALAMLGEIEPNKKLRRQWINAAFRAINYLAQSRKDGNDIPADHWVLIATARLWPLYEQSDKSVSKEDLLVHAAQIIYVLTHDGALQDVRTTPIATRLEGLLAALAFLPPKYKEERDKIQVEVDRGITFLLKTQVKEGPLKGGVPRSYTEPGDESPDRRADEIRIDYVQHALSAWLEYARQNGIIQRAGPEEAMKTKRISPSSLFSLGCLLFLCGCAQKEPPPAKTDASQLISAMKDGAEYMTRACKPSGEFVYLANLSTGMAYEAEYNVLRHAGSLYAMADYYGHKSDPKIKAALVRSARFLKQKYLKPISGQKDMLAIWALPSDEKGGVFEVKLGGLGLGLVGLVGVDEAAPGTTPLKTLRQLGNAILFMQEENGSFYSKYDPAKGGKLAQWDSLYYPGEAALGLAMLAEIETDPDQKKRWINAAFRAIGFLARERETTGQVPPDHWVLIATARLWPLHAFSDHSVSKAVLLKHAVSIAEVLARDGALRDVRTSPIATRLEGLLAALTFLPPEQKELRDEIHVKVEKGIQFLMKTQVGDGPLKGGIVQAYTAPSTKKVEERADEIRIDYVQHALSAWLEYARQQGILQPKTNN